MKPAATIVVPLRRQVDAYLEQSLISALEQTVAAEVIVVISHETPESNLAVVERVATQARDKLTVVTRDREGFAAALNTGFDRARADRVAILFTDDWLDPDTIEACLAYSADIVCGGKRTWRDDGAQREVVFQWVGNHDRFAKQPTMEHKASYLTHFFLFSRALVLRLGGVDETLGDLAGVDDFDLPWRMLEAGATVDFAATPHYNVRDHSGERLTLRAPEDSLRSLELILDKHHVSADERPEIIERHSRWYGRMISDVLREDDRV